MRPCQQVEACEQREPAAATAVENCLGGGYMPPTRSAASAHRPNRPPALPLSPSWLRRRVMPPTASPFIGRARRAGRHRPILTASGAAEAAGTSEVTPSRPAPAAGRLAKAASSGAANYETQWQKLAGSRQVASAAAAASTRRYTGTRRRDLSIGQRRQPSAGAENSTGCGIGGLRRRRRRPRRRPAPGDEKRAAAMLRRHRRRPHDHRPSSRDRASGEAAVRRPPAPPGAGRRDGRRGEAALLYPPTVRSAVSSARRSTDQASPNSRPARRRGEMTTRPPVIRTAWRMSPVACLGRHGCLRRQCRNADVIDGVFCMRLIRILCLARRHRRGVGGDAGIGESTSRTLSSVINIIAASLHHHRRTDSAINEPRRA